MAKKSLTQAVSESVAEADRLAADAELARLRAELASVKGRYKSALAALDAANDQIGRAHV